MLSLNILYIVNRDLFHMRHNNQDDSCSLTSSTAENNYNTTARGRTHRIFENRLDLNFLLLLK